MFCPICGSPNDNGASKCQACGSALNTQINNAQSLQAPSQTQSAYEQQAPQVVIRDREAERQMRKQNRRNKPKIGSRIVGTVFYGVVSIIAFILICVACALNSEVEYGAGTLLGIIVCVMAAIPYLVIMIVGLAGLARQIRTKNIVGIILSGIMIVMPVVTEIFFIILFTSQRG